MTIPKPSNYRLGLTNFIIEAVHANGPTSRNGNSIAGTRTTGRHSNAKAVPSVIQLLAKVAIFLAL